ncbi:sugar ABC transporter permease [Lachnospiraceae bacterium 54-53]
MEKTLSNRKAIFIFTFPALLIFLFIVISSIVMSFYYSMTEWDGISGKVFVGLDNYKSLFFHNTDGFLKALGNSLILAGLSIVGELVPATALAIILARGVKWEGFFRTVFFIPVLLSSVVLGQLWGMIYNPTYGLLNSVLLKAGLIKSPAAWLGSPKTALACTFAVVIWQYIGYHMLLIYSGVKRIPQDIFEAAEIDGATRLQTAFRIIIPLALPTIKTSMVLAVIGSLKMFDLVYVLTGGGPNHATEVASTLMYTSIFKKNLYGYGSSMAIFIVLECLIFTILLNLWKPKQYTY